jgi:tryptophanyl-tRNA synthetase
MSDPSYIDQVLANGGERASAMAAETLSDVRQIVGLIK